MIVSHSYTWENNNNSLNILEHGVTSEGEEGGEQCYNTSGRKLPFTPGTLVWYFVGINLWFSFSSKGKQEFKIKINRSWKVIF